MKSSKPPFILKSFEGLNVLLKHRPSPLLHPPVDTPHEVKDEGKQAPDNEQRLFKEAMTDVTPISRDNRKEKNTEIILPDSPQNDDDAEVLSQLSNLVNKGEGFVIAQTPEYIEGTGYNVNPEIAKRLHRGDFAMEANIDLHGLSVEEARDVFEQFLNETVRTGKRAVLIVHGRGLCSPKKPVLKTKIVEWLTRGHWRKRVVAFSSARACDGGTGATYVLLRQHPLSKRFRKKK